MLSNRYMIYALIASVLVSFLLPLIGNTLVLRRLSTIGEAMSHISLAGVLIGLVSGIQPVLSAVIFSIIGGLFIEKIRTTYPKYSEISVSILLSVGIGIAAILSDFATGGMSFNSYLFGSIVLVKKNELYVLALLLIITIIFSFINFEDLFMITFDEEHASLAGVPVKTINTLFSVLTSVIIAIVSKTVGVLIVSSLIVIPSACSFAIAKSYKQALFYSIGFANLITVVGLIISYYTGLKPAGTMVLFGVVVLTITILSSRKKN